VLVLVRLASTITAPLVLNSHVDRLAVARLALACFELALTPLVRLMLAFVMRRCSRAATGLVLWP